MTGQLDRLRSVLSLPRVSLGVLPSGSPYRVPTDQFIMFDDRMVHVGSAPAEFTITQPREIALYAKAFHELSKAAVYGRRAPDPINQALSVAANAELIRKAGLGGSMFVQRWTFVFTFTRCAEGRRCVARPGRRRPHRRGSAVLPGEQGSGRRPRPGRRPGRSSR